MWKFKRMFLMLKKVIVKKYKIYFHKTKLRQWAPEKLSA
jgi:hypothetical protein